MKIKAFLFKVINIFRSRDKTTVGDRHANSVIHDETDRHVSA